MAAREGVKLKHGPALSRGHLTGFNEKASTHVQCIDTTTQQTYHARTTYSIRGVEGVEELKRGLAKP